jgi:hypothetical protein
MAPWQTEFPGSGMTSNVYRASGISMEKSEHADGLVVDGGGGDWGH